MAFMTRRGASPPFRRPRAGLSARSAACLPPERIAPAKPALERRTSMGRVRVGLGWVVIPAVLMVGLSSCASMRAEKPVAAGPSVYKQLGGREGIAIIVDDFAA